MEYTNCCNAPFGPPGWPDCDLCSACKEHAEPTEPSQGEFEHMKQEVTRLRDKKLHCEIKKSNDNPFGLDDL